MTTTTRGTLAAALLVCASPLCMAPAAAGTITLEAGALVPGVPPASPPPPATSTDGTFVFANESATDVLTGDSASAGAGGNGEGFFRVRAGGTNNFASFATADFSDTYTNTSGVAQDVSFDYEIFGGQISLGCGLGFIGGPELAATTFPGTPPDSCLGSDAGTGSSALATLTVDIIATLDNGDVLGSFNSFVDLVLDASGPTVLESVDLLPFASADTSTTDRLTYSWAGGSASLDLGSIAAGSSVEVTYDVALLMQGLWTGPPGGCFGELQEGPLPIDGGDGVLIRPVLPGEGECLDANGRFGDPVTFSSSAGSFATAAAVPTPAPLALLGLGLLALAGRRRA